MDIYADEASSGTKTDKREDFNRLLADCRKGKIDRVLVKSISRFSRNTKDWDRAFGDVGWFHITGITSAIMETVQKALGIAVDVEVASGVPDRRPFCALETSKPLRHNGYKGTRPPTPSALISPERPSGCEEPPGNPVYRKRPAR